MEPDPAPIRRHLIVHGRVQGVAYRASAAAAARRIGVAGWVRNLRDGTVEGVVEGDPESVARFVEWCQSGPPLARVDRLVTREEEPRGEVGFEIR